MGFTLESVFYCTKCGSRLPYPIPRRGGKQRPAGHLKKIWCDKCNAEVNHVECKPYTKYDFSDFQLEFKYKNFSENGNRKMSYGLFRDSLVKKGIDIHEFED